MTQSIRRFAALAVALACLFAAAPIFAADAPSQHGVVNVNTATAVELARLPGVGPALAQRILEHREKNGAFKSVEDLMLVRGIGEKSFERIRPYVATAGATTLSADVPSPRPARKAQAGAQG
jgi:competence ComEA-like helix-hairpin-helix protein